MKRILLSFFLIIFLIPHQYTLANEQKIYYNQEYKYSITFPQDWYMYSEEMKQTLSPDELKNSPAAFVRKDGSSQMFIRHLPSDDPKFILYKNAINYVKNTPKDTQKMYRVLNPISTQLGRTIHSYKIDKVNETVELQLSKTSPQFGEIFTTIFWKEYKGTLIEFEFYHFGNNPSLKAQASEINNSFTFPSSALKTNIKEGSINSLKNISLTETVNDHSVLYNIIKIIKLPIVFEAVLGIIFVLILARIIYKVI